ncbi:MAG: Zn-ribbon domain-containing OB-fold protein, partial [Euryarchaeota archaeon]|nr:Zn-ribbon domain-containing OB-fold protein [Euryarchaeota archaeon]
THYFPPRKICPKCRRLGQIEENKFKGTGAIETYTIVHSSPEAFERLVPYVLAIVQLDEGPRVTTQVVCPPEEAKIGMRVRAVFRRMGQEGDEGAIHYGFKFAPDGESPAPKV